MTAENIACCHAFTTRVGGVSNGVYESLNLGTGSGDDSALVSENYDILCRALSVPVSGLVGMRQVHGSRIIVVKREDCGKLFLHGSFEADGMITREAGVALIVYAADCVPILLHDPVSGVVGAVHSGWRGTSHNIVGAAVRKMSYEFGCAPADISAAIGPCISKCCYETDIDVACALRKVLDDAAENCITSHGRKFMVDLKEANRLLLRKAGLSDITISDECTYCRSDKYWSHRRTNGRRGSQAAVIAINQ